MRIISKFRDYYDSAMGYGIDTTQVLIRETAEVGKVDEESVWDHSSPDWIRHSFDSQDIHYSEFVVGFCGKDTEELTIVAGLTNLDMPSIFKF